ncbi:hypothetical protein [Tolypothrix sp. NIES-4075]|uniref:hypothetical protein n=1 Tax=Tolypothrix sp. NIES-4075 TaxID=2005459 RepID=UPI00117C82E2|nr:hypothetical protein [Tolypothrix sp. NIES-4075]
MLIISPPFNKVMPSHIFRECDRQYFVVWTEGNFIELGAIEVLEIRQYQYFCCLTRRAIA